MINDIVFPINCRTPSVVIRSCHAHTGFTESVLLQWYRMACKYTQKVRTSILISVTTGIRWLLISALLFLSSHFVRFRVQNHLNGTKTIIDKKKVWVIGRSKLLLLKIYSGFSLFYSFLFQPLLPHLPSSTSWSDVMHQAHRMDIVLKWQSIISFMVSKLKSFETF